MANQFDEKWHPPAAPGRKSLSMHQDVPVWYDCCSCEAEPYWVEAFERHQGDAEDEAQAGPGES